jgi:hypothetical protein
MILTCIHDNWEIHLESLSPDHWSKWYDVHGVYDLEIANTLIHF